MDKDGVPAKPGDLLAVEICNLGPLPGDEWGYTATFDRENGGGFLTDHFPCATKAIWYFEGIYAYSPQIPGDFSTSGPSRANHCLEQPHLPSHTRVASSTLLSKCNSCIAGVRFPGLTHPGIIGTAPSEELLGIWNERERKLVENGLESLKLCEVLHQRPLANLPTTKGCVLGKVGLIEHVMKATIKRSFSSSCVFLSVKIQVSKSSLISTYRSKRALRNGRR